MPLPCTQNKARQGIVSLSLPCGPSLEHKLVAQNGMVSPSRNASVKRWIPQLPHLRGPLKDCQQLQAAYPKGSGCRRLRKPYEENAKETAGNIAGASKLFSQRVTSACDTFPATPSCQRSKATKRVMPSRKLGQSERKRSQAKPSLASQGMAKQSKLASEQNDTKQQTKKKRTNGRTGKQT